MKRSKYYKIIATVCWIMLLLNLSLINYVFWYTYISIIGCLIVIYATSYKTYKRKLIALFLLSLIKFNKNYLIYGGFCYLIRSSFNIKWSSNSFLTNFIKYIRPIDLNIEFKDPLMKPIGFWFDPFNWEIRINYLKTILKE